MSPHKAFIQIQQALELDSALDCTEMECDTMFQEVKSLINKPYDPDTNWTLLHLACAHGNDDFARRIVDCGAHVNLQSSDRKTPYFLVPDFAADLKEFLISHGAITDPAYFESKEPEFKSSGFLNANFGRKIGICFIMPFFFLLLSNGILFALKFVACSILFYFVAAGYFIASLTRRPVWYDYDPDMKELPRRNLPDEWKVAYHNPKVHFGIDFEEVTFVSDGSGTKYLLKGWYIPGSKKEGVPRREMSLIFTHGGGRDRRSWLRHLPIFHDAGYTCLMYDMSEHGMSSGTGLGLSYGIRERWDVKAASEYMKFKRGWKKVAAIGTSVGGAATISGSAMAPDTIDAVIAENPMLTCSQLQNVLLHRVVGPLFRGTWFSKRVFSLLKKLSSMWLNFLLGNFPSKKCQPFHTVCQIAPRPLLLMHGTFDETVPAAHGQKLFDLAKEPKEMWLLPEGTHCNLFDQAPVEYKRRVLDFLDRAENPVKMASLHKTVSSASLVSMYPGSRHGSPRKGDTNKGAAAAASSSSSQKKLDEPSGMFSSPSVVNELLGTDTFVDDSVPQSPVPGVPKHQQQQKQQAQFAGNKKQGQQQQGGGGKKKKK